MEELTGILTRLEAVLGRLDGEPVPLQGGITNHNYRVGFAGRECVVRVPGKATDRLGIDRRSERLAAARAAELGLAPELLFVDEDCSVTAFVPSMPLDAARLLADPGPVARALRSFHDCGLALPARFWIPDLLRGYAEVVAEHGATPPTAYASAQALVDRIAAVLPLRDPVPCHNDLLAGNLLQTAAGVMLVDWEYAGTGHRYFDLGNLAVNNDLDDGAETRLLEAYFGSPDNGGRRAALKLMRIVSDAREAAWGVVQGLISELDFDFAGYAAAHFERLLRAAADPRLKGFFDAATP
jgi:hypothetical protein